MPDENGEQLAATFEELLRPVDHGQTSTTKYRRFEIFLGRLSGFPPDLIYTSYIARPSNFDVRMTQSRRAREALLRVALVPNDQDVQPNLAQAMRLAEERNPGSSVLLVLDADQGETHAAWRPVWGVSPDLGTPTPGGARGDLAPLERVIGFQLHRYPYRIDGPTKDITQAAVSGARVPPNPSPIAIVPPIVDTRIQRMLQNAVASSKAIMLVGPPGTGKSTLVEALARDSAANPAAYGLTHGHDLSVVTPDESWTTRDLVGGLSVTQEGLLQFAPGHVLQAIAANKWLLLDEANRADLDKIFGGLLTWLAGQEVTVGRVSPGSPEEVILSWSTGLQSGVESQSDAEGQPIAKVYRAGRDWRLLGTYNSLDAHRVFRLGLALGRRFAQVPVPPPPPDLFREIVQQRAEGDLDAEAGQRLADVVARIYEIHNASKAAALGPALFLGISRYVSTGLKLDGPGPSMGELLAEAYLSGFGTWLARLDDDVLDALGSYLEREDALGSQWEWVRGQLPNLA